MPTNYKRWVNAVRPYRVISCCHNTALFIADTCASYLCYLCLVPVLHVPRICATCASYLCYMCIVSVLHLSHVCATCASYLCYMYMHLDDQLTPPSTKPFPPAPGNCPLHSPTERTPRGTNSPLQHSPHCNTPLTACHLSNVSSPGHNG